MSVKKLFDLTDRVALVTGGSRGLGLQMAEALGEMGARVALTARKAPELEEAAEHLRSQGVQVMVVPCDLASDAAAKLMVDQVVARWQHVDILINNAGATWGAPAEEHPLEAWQKVLNLNLTAAFVVSQAVGRRSMIPRRSGRIINIASVAGLSGTHPRFMRTLAYNTSKGGLINFTRSLAAEWAQYDITVNAIAPGVFPSKMSRVMMERGKDMIMELTPLKRFGGEEDLKGVTVLLASDASSYITGQIIAVDGGMSAI
jgi:gluconate 5-dehydrogenase